MKGTFVCLLAVTGLLGAFSVNPGLQYRVTENGLNWGVQVGFTLVEKFLIGKDLPAVSAEDNLNGADFSFTMRDWKIARLDRGDVKFAVGNGDITVSGKGFGGQMVGTLDFKYQKGSKNIEDTVKFDLDFNIDSTFGNSINVDSNGRAQLKVTKCEFNLNSHSISLEGGNSEEYLDVIEEFIAKYKDEVCFYADYSYEKFVNPILADLPMQVTIPKIGVFDFHFTKSPKIVPHFFESYHTAAFYGLDDFSDPPFVAKPFPDAPGSEMRMATVWVSDFVANSFFYVVKEKLQIEIDPELLGDKYGDYLKINCDGAICFGIILPQETADKYPNGVAVIRARATKQPMVTVTSDAVKADIQGQIEVFVRDQSTGKEDFLFSADVTANGGVFVSIDDMKVKFEIKNLDVALKMIENEVDGLYEGDLNMLIRLGLNSIVIPRLNKIGAEGIELPGLDEVPYSKASVHLFDHAVVLMADGGN